MTWKVLFYTNNNNNSKFIGQITKYEINKILQIAVFFLKKIHEMDKLEWEKCDDQRDSELSMNMTNQSHRIVYLIPGPLSYLTNTAFKQ